MATADNNGKKKIDAKWWLAAANGSQKFVGQIVTPVILGGLAGWWLDKKFNSAPWLFASLVFLGFVISIVSLLKKIKKP
ncbi:MAG: AtpZ/AtpI family protein [bacterium]|nr:AtpZ/AtpI family protein [bacterium]